MEQRIQPQEKRVTKKWGTSGAVLIKRCKETPYRSAGCELCVGYARD